jgi:ribosome-associated translation inhibitor RaiA
MTPLLFALALLQTAPESAPEPESTPAETLAGLEQVYSTTCGQAGILYHSYDDLCDGLRKQIRAYREKVDKEQAKAATHAKPATPAAKPQS